MIWIKFLICAVVIVIAGIRLTVYADLLSDRLKLGKMWIGIVLLGLVTSLPEAVSSIAAVTSLDAADLAVGNLVGSNNFNLMLIVVMDIVYRKGSVTDEIHPTQSHKTSALYAILLSFILAAEIISSLVGQIFPIGPLSMGTALICWIYFLGMKRLSNMGALADTVPGVDLDDDSKDISMAAIVGNLLLCAVLVVGSAIWLANICDAIAAATGWGRTFVGSILLALATSLPEMVVTLSSLKLKAFDLAMGNIFGSNMVNTFIVFIADFFDPGPILFSVSQAHVVTIILSMLLTAIVMIGISFRKKKTFFGLGWDSWILIVLFVSGTQILYQLR